MHESRDISMWRGRATSRSTHLAHLTRLHAREGSVCVSVRILEASNALVCALHMTVGARQRLPTRRQPSLSQSNNTHETKALSSRFSLTSMAACLRSVSAPLMYRWSGTLELM